MVRGAKADELTMRARRREFLCAAAAGAASFVAGCATPTPSRSPAARVVVIGGGYGGATAAKYLRVWSDGRVDVTLIESNARFVSCPLSNLVIGGSKQIADLTTPYDDLARRHGVRVVRDTAAAVDAASHRVRLASGADVAYDRLILSPGVDFIWHEVPGLDNADAQARILHGWKAGGQTVALRRELEAMRDGGVFAIVIPPTPYRCPPAPYERACQAAWYFKRAKPRSKVLVLDANPDVTSKGALFRHAWEALYAGIVEYRPNHGLAGVDARALTAKFDVDDDVSADVLNVIPPQRAGAIARSAGVVTANDRWCDVDFLTFESVAAADVHVLGDAIQIAPGMPKSGHMANQQAKVCAAAVIALIDGEATNPQPVLSNTCYSYITDKAVVHVASVHQYDRARKTLMPVEGAGGLSPAMSELEGRYAESWARNIWADMLA